MCRTPTRRTPTRCLRRSAWSDARSSSERRETRRVITSAGILLYRLLPEPQVLIAHMGGPFWAAKDAGAWSIPKGEFAEGEETALDAALREFGEELGVPAPEAAY